MKIDFKNADKYGAATSTICLIHCLVTPLLFFAQSNICCHKEVPLWWTSLDYIFLFISFLAVSKSTKNTTHPKLKLVLWVVFSILSFCIINEKIKFIYLTEVFTQITAGLMAITHLYSLKIRPLNKHVCC